MQNDSNKTFIQKVEIRNCRAECDSLLCFSECVHNLIPISVYSSQVQMWWFFSNNSIFNIREREREGEKITRTSNNSCRNNVANNPAHMYNEPCVFVRCIRRHRHIFFSFFFSQIKRYYTESIHSFICRLSQSFIHLNFHGNFGSLFGFLFIICWLILKEILQ